MLDEAGFSFPFPHDVVLGLPPFPRLGDTVVKERGLCSIQLTRGPWKHPCVTPGAEHPGMFLMQPEGELFRSYLELLITQAGNPRYPIECQQPSQSGLEELYTHGLHKDLQDPSFPRADQTLLLFSIKPPW